MNLLKSFPPEPWFVTESEYEKDALERNATLFFLGNGYMGFRGGFEEAEADDGTKGTFVNGFYESAPQVYGESAFGFPDKKQSILNLPDPTGLRIFLDDEEFSLKAGRLLEYERKLSLKEGLLSRTLVWESPQGRRVKLLFRRCVSAAREHLAVISCTVSRLEGVQRLRIESCCKINAAEQRKGPADPRKSAGFAHAPIVCLEKRVKDGGAVLLQETANSRLQFAEAVENSVGGGLVLEASEDRGGEIVFSYSGIPFGTDEVFVLNKYIAFYSSIEASASDLADLAEAEAVNAEKSGIGLILSEHMEAVDLFWNRADIRIDDEALQQGIRFNLYSIFQSAGRDGLRNISAKGLSSEGYEGHYFWDTEIYVIPFFSYTFPETASRLLEYRYNILDKARARASVMSEKGALFPWRTINGEEASAYFPAGTAQYHINADIAYGISRYVKVSGDNGFMTDFGLEILIETARFWMSLGFFNSSGEFRINCVTGPDEYTAIVNNNYFTNVMAQYNLQYAAESAESVRQNAPEVYFELSARLGLAQNEIESWKAAARAMYLPYSSSLCIHAQDDTFLDKEPWDFSDKSLNRHPLLLHLHPLVIYRYQILKQPDVVLANFLRNSSFSRIGKMRDYEYYNRITTGDSSLAPCIQSIMAAELGRPEEAYKYFMRTARMDLDDINSNAVDGIHIAAMGGTWLSLVYGFGGLRDLDGELSLCPRLPAAWGRLEFNLRFHGKELNVSIRREKTVYSLTDETGSVTLNHMGTTYTVQAGAPVEVSMKPELKGVIFDLDGVITDTSEFHYLAWKRLADEMGYTFSREINERLRGIGRLESLDIILESSGAELSSEERFQQGELKNGYYRELLESIKPENVLPGISELMMNLRKNGIRSALASASRNAASVIKRLGIENMFDCVMDAAAVERGKPDPEIFVSAAEALGLLPEQCAGIEDAAAGVEAIRASGMFSVGVGPAAGAADWAVDETSELHFETLLDRFRRAAGQ